MEKSLKKAASATAQTGLVNANAELAQFDQLLVPAFGVPSPMGDPTWLLELVKTWYTQEVSDHILMKLVL